MRRALASLLVGSLIWLGSSRSAADLFTYYTLEDLGPLGPPGTQARSLDGFARSHLYKCRIGSANGINQIGDIVATRVDSSNNPYVTVNDEVLPAANGWAVGCAVSDDGYVVGGDAVGGNGWAPDGREIRAIQIGIP